MAAKLALEGSASNERFLTLRKHMASDLLENGRSRAQCNAGAEIVEFFAAEFHVWRKCGLEPRERINRPALGG
jgi:hypothetical protein